MRRTISFASVSLLLAACDPGDNNNNNNGIEENASVALSAEINGFDAAGAKFAIFGQREETDPKTGEIVSQLSVFVSDDNDLCTKMGGATFAADFEAGLVAGTFAAVAITVAGPLPQAGDTISPVEGQELPLVLSAFQVADGAALQALAISGGTTGVVVVEAFTPGESLSLDAQGVKLIAEAVSETLIDVDLSLETVDAVRCEALDAFF